MCKRWEGVLLCVRDRCVHIVQALCNADYIPSYLAHPPDANLASNDWIPCQMLSAVSASFKDPVS